jgi:hypothetical protein
MPRRKRKDPEYTLNIFQRFDDRTASSSTVFVVQTIKEFISFRYEILLESAVEGTIIDLKIRGLRTTPLIMPNVGPARGVREYPDLNGIYRLLVTKLDDESNELTLNISEQGITIQSATDPSFIRVSTQPIPYS